MLPHNLEREIDDTKVFGEPLVSTTLQYSLRKSLRFHRQWYRVLAIGLNFFIIFFEEKINDRVDQNPMATGTVGPIKI